jgi:hypothetical protein
LDALWEICKIKGEMMFVQDKNENLGHVLQHGTIEI